MYKNFNVVMYGCILLNSYSPNHMHMSDLQKKNPKLLS